MKNNPIRVLHVIGGVMDYGGTEMFLMNYYRNINKDEVQFDFLLTGLEKGVFDDEIVMLKGRLFNVPSKKQNLVKNIIGTYRVLKSNKTSIIHSHLDGMNGLILGLAALAGNKVRISHSHNTQHLTNNKIKIFIHNLFKILSRMFATHFMSASHEASKWLHGEKITAKKNKVIVNAISYPDFQFDAEIRDELRTELNLSDKFVLGHVGRFHFQKNHMFLLNLVAEVAKQNEAVMLLLVGDGELRSEMESKIMELKIQNHVLMVGKSSNTSRYYNVFDLFLLPSVFEGLGIVAIEAQVNGLNVLASLGVPSLAKISNQMKFLETRETAYWVEQVLTHIEQFNVNKDENLKIREIVEVSKTYDIASASGMLVTNYKELQSLNLYEQ